MSLNKNVIDDNYCIYEDDRFHKLGTDTVLLSKFINLKRGSKICDLGVGQGGLSLLAFIKESSIAINGVEIDEGAAEIAKYNMIESGFSDRFTLTVGDMRHLDKALRNSFDMVMTNPPYFKSGCGRQSEDRERITAREDTQCTPEELCTTAASLLKSGGDFYLVYRSARLCDIIGAMRFNKLEPKRIQFVYGKSNACSKIVLIYAKKGGNQGMDVMPPLILN